MAEYTNVRRFIEFFLPSLNRNNVQEYNSAMSPDRKEALEKWFLSKQFASMVGPMILIATKGAGTGKCFLVFLFFLFFFFSKKRCE